MGFTRRSFVPRIKYVPIEYRYGDANSTLAKAYGWNFDGLMVSEPHWLLKGGQWSGGGPLYVYHQKSTVDEPIPILGVKNSIPFNYRTTIGTLTKANPYSSIPVPPSFSSVNADMSADYVKGYAKARPGNPTADLGQFIAELRDLPSVPFKKLLKGPAKGLKQGKIVNGRFDMGNTKTLYEPLSNVPFRSWGSHAYQQLSDFRNLGSEYLNVVFGWKPFVNDLRKLYETWKNIDKQMAKIIRENGKGIRRKATVSDEEVSNSYSETSYSVPFANCIGGSPITDGVCRYITQTRTHERRWFVGKFRYYIPDVTSSAWTTRAKLALFGALPTPELLWNVLPWTWLIDWFSTVGDSISNMSQNAVDNLTCKYSYTMKHVYTIREDILHYTVPYKGTPTNRWGPYHGTLRGTRTTETKLRIGGGNPFGLNVQLPSLSTYQLSILAALGLSRGLVK